MGKFVALCCNKFREDLLCQWHLRKKCNQFDILFRVSVRKFISGIFLPFEIVDFGTQFCQTVAMGPDHRCIAGCLGPSSITGSEN